MIFIVILLGFALRLISINQSFWLDEATSAIVATEISLSQILNSFSPSDFHPPLYYLLLNLWAGIFGSSELALRLPSVLFGLASVYFVYKIAMKIFDKKIAVLAALFLAINPLHIYYSQEARMYSQATFLVTLVIYCYIHKRFWLTGVVFALAVFSDYLAIFLLPVLLVGKRPPQQIIKIILPVAILGIAWIGVFSQQLSRGLAVKSNASSWWDILGKASIKQVVLIPVKFIFGRISFIDKYIYAIVVAWGFIFVGLGLIKAIIDWRKLKLIWAWLVLPTVFAIFVSLFIPVLYYFRLLFCLPALALLLAYSVRNSKFLQIILIILLLLSSFYYLFTPKFYRENWRDLVSFVNSTDTKAIAIFPSESQMEAFRFYSNKLVNPIHSSGPVGISQNYQTIWLLRYVNDIFDPQDNYLKEVLDNGFTKVGEYGFNGVVVWKYKNENIN